MFLARTPLEMFTGEVPDQLSRWRIFGAQGWVKGKGSNKKKLEPNEQECHMVGLTSLAIRC